MLLVILICTSAGACDRIAQPVDTCFMSELAAQVILAKGNLVHPGDRVTVKCGKPT